jgi:broad specificity phosphatase PhoE
MLQMKKPIIFALLMALLVTATIFAQESENGPSYESTTFILVRHAEKMSDSDDPGLTQEGVSRANKLQEMVVMANVNAIYSTNFERTRATVQPVSEMVDVPVTMYEPVPGKNVTEQWIKKHRGETVLISGHSNTIPGLANQLLGRTYFENDLDESDYGNLLIITVGENDRTLLHLRY